MEIEILPQYLLFFYLNLTVWLSCLKTWVDVSWVGAYQKGEINDKGGICVTRDVT